MSDLRVDTDFVQTFKVVLPEIAEVQSLSNTEGRFLDFLDTTYRWCRKTTVNTYPAIISQFKVKYKINTLRVA